MNPMMRITLLVVACAGWAVAGAGCRTEGVETYTYDGKPQNQLYELDAVKQRVARLERGMSKMQVLLTLGSPAKRQADRWVYLPSRTGTIVPAEALEVRFVNDRYVEHRWQPIVVGERIITE
jgi:outer membrane protein assembly factor BamE (lipoprotein component of BamABCDE complex)